MELITKDIHDDHNEQIKLTFSAQGHNHRYTPNGDDIKNPILATLTSQTSGSPEGSHGLLSRNTEDRPGY